MERETEKILENIRRKRNKRKISILTLSTAVGISHSHLYYIETKRVIPSIDVLVKIAKALGLDLRDLLDWPDSPPPLGDPLGDPPGGPAGDSTGAPSGDPAGG
jgi:transcriptional regulator with XRE-family HTH domain